MSAAGEDEAPPLDLAGDWTRVEEVTPGASWHHTITVHEGPPDQLYHVRPAVLERLLTEAGYTRTSPDTTQETP